MKTLIPSMAIIAVLSAGAPARAQSYPDPSTLVCSSNNGRRTFCEAYTGGGVRMVRQIGRAPCDEGYSWGYSDRGVWVDRGCRAEFSLAERRENSYPYNSGQFSMIRPGAVLPVRTNEFIDSNRADGRVFTGFVDQDVRGENGEVAIPRGSPVELIVRVAPDNDLILDLDSVMVNGRRYAVRADAERVEARDGLGRNRRTGEYVGGGAVLGSIIGAIAGGGKGAAIGAAAGAAAGAGAQTLTRGRLVRVPAESLLTFRMERPLEVGVPDTGVTRDGRHYHDYYPRDYNPYDRPR